MGLSKEHKLLEIHLDFEISTKISLFSLLQTIDWVMRIEDDFFPVIAGELGTSKESCEHHQRKLQEYMPTCKVRRWYLSFLYVHSLLIGWWRRRSSSSCRTSQAALAKLMRMLRKTRRDWRSLLLKQRSDTCNCKHRWKFSLKPKLLFNWIENWCTHVLKQNIFLWTESPRRDGAALEDCWVAVSQGRHQRTAWADRKWAA